MGGCFVSIRSVDGVLSFVRGPFRSYGPFSGLRRIGRSDELAELCHRVILLKNGRVNGAGAHEVREILEKGSPFVDGIEALRLLLAELGEFEGENAESVLDEMVEDLARMSGFYGIGLDHGKGAVS